MNNNTIIIKADVYNLYPFKNNRWYLEFGTHFCNYEGINEDSILLLVLENPFGKRIYESRFIGSLEYSIKKHPPRNKFTDNPFVFKIVEVHILNNFMDGGIDL